MQDYAMKYVYFAAIVLLPGLSRSQPKCELFKTGNSTEQGPPVLQATRTVWKIWYTGKFGSLQCCAFGLPSPSISWFINGQRIDLSTNYRLRLMDNNQSLWISGLRKTDSGLYTCQASNQKGNVSRSFQVEVKSTLLLQEPVVILKPDSWSPVLGSNLTLNCTILKSARKPFVFWLYQKNIDAKPWSIRRSAKHYVKYAVNTEKVQSWLSQLFIRNVTMDDEGIYTCMVRNGLKAANDTGVLTVKEDEPLDGGVSEFATAEPDKQRLTWIEERPYLKTVAAVFAGGLFIIVMVVYLVWRRRKRQSGSPGYVVDDKDNHPGSSAENNFLILPYDKTPENIQLLKCGVDESELDFDVFVSYSSQDREFVKDVVYTELVTTHSVCIDFKDFEAGLYIGDNIMNSIYRSRKTLLVVTQNFLKGEWTYFEMQIAQGRIAQGHDVLIPVIVDDIRYDELPKPLQHYRQTKTLLEYFNEDVKPHFWDRLRSALGPTIEMQGKPVTTTLEVQEEPETTTPEVQEKPVATPESPEDESAVGQFV